MDDGAFINVRYAEMRHRPPEVMARLAQGERVDPSEYYVLVAPVFRDLSGAVCFAEQNPGSGRRREADAERGGGGHQGPLLPPSGLTRQPRSPKGLGHRIAASGPGIASACRRLGRSKTSLRSRWAHFGGCRIRPRFRSLIEPHCQRDPTAFWVDLQHLDTNDIARLRNLAWVLDVSIGHRGDVHQPVLVDSDIADPRAFPPPLGSSPS